LKQYVTKSEYVTESDEVKALEWNGLPGRYGTPFQTAVALAVYDSKYKCKEGGGGVIMWCLK
jgi:hypothetical protein